MKIDFTKNNGVLNVALDGRLDTTTAPEFEKTIGELLDGVSDLTLDMKKVSYVSSAGLRVILKIQKAMFKQGKMKLIGVKNIQDVMDLLF